MRDVDRDSEVVRIATAFKLNPYEHLNLRFDATPEEVKKQYRKLSLVVHPDKCKHPNAKDAFDLLRAAQEWLLDEARRAELHTVLDLAKEEVLKARAKEAKKDVTVKVAALIHDDGRQGVEQAWQQSDDFHEQWRLKSREFLAQAEWRRRQLNKRIAEEEARMKDAKEKEKEGEVKKRKHEENLKSSRDARVSSWRDFANVKKAKADGPDAKKVPVGGLRPPKAKTEDSDRTYVQRAVRKEDAW